MKKLLLTIAVTFGMTALTMAQNVPFYVPTNGLLAYYPFNGNPNDLSGNGNHLQNNGVSFSSDRFGNTNSALIFGTQAAPFPSRLQKNTPNTSGANFTYSVWVKRNSISDDGSFLGESSNNSGGDFSTTYLIPQYICQGVQGNVTGSSYVLQVNIWYHLVITKNANMFTIYVNGVQNSQGNSGFASFNGTTVFYVTGNDCQMDDIGVWNRSLTQQEIYDLYNAANCANNTIISPQTNTLLSGSTASFSANTSDPNPNYVWQCDFGQGYVNLNNYGNYSGTNTGTLNIANVQLPNHTQPFRVITTSGNCIDTSNVAIISLADTCINTITDTTLITVTDTLVINTTITSLPPPNNANTIKVFPNPTNDHITIDYGNFSVMNGYQLKIENSLGQQVFQTNITQQSDYLNLTSWGGNGLYFVHIIDPQGNTIDIRKIVLQ